MNLHRLNNQEQERANKFGTTIRVARVLAALVLGTVCVGSVLARQDAHSSGTGAGDGAAAVGHLVFDGTTGTVGMGAHHDDQLIFAAGNFHSRECAKLGFEKSRVEIARDDAGFHFSAVNVSEKYGTLTWNGSIRDGSIEAHYVWKKERLFWTIEREYWFSGEIDDAVN